MYNHDTKTKSKAIMWQRRVKERLAPNYCMLILRPSISVHSYISFILHIASPQVSMVQISANRTFLGLQYKRRESINFCLSSQSVSEVSSSQSFQTITYCIWKWIKSRRMKYWRKLVLFFSFAKILWPDCQVLIVHHHHHLPKSIIGARGLVDPVAHVIGQVDTVAHAGERGDEASHVRECIDELCSSFTPWRDPQLHLWSQLERGEEEEGHTSWVLDAVDQLPIHFYRWEGWLCSPDASTRKYLSHHRSVQRERQVYW